MSSERRHGGHAGRLRIRAHCAHHGKRMPQHFSHTLVFKEALHVRSAQRAQDNLPLQPGRLNCKQTA